LRGGPKVGKVRKSERSSNELWRALLLIHSCLAADCEDTAPGNKNIL
jgi:hypothetical protein